MRWLEIQPDTLYVAIWANTKTTCKEMNTFMPFNKLFWDWSTDLIWILWTCIKVPVNEWSSRSRKATIWACTNTKHSKSHSSFRTSMSLLKTRHMVLWKRFSLSIGKFCGCLICLIHKCRIMCNIEICMQINFVFYWFFPSVIYRNNLFRKPFLSVLYIVLQYDVTTKYVLSCIGCRIDNRTTFVEYLDSDT